MITQTEFDKRVRYNTDLFNKQIKVNTFTPSKYYLFDKKPKELSTIEYGKLYHDIYAAAVCGTLVLSDLQAKDSVMMKREKLTKVELKTCYIKTKSIFKNTVGNLIVGYRTPILNYIGATYKRDAYHEEDMPLYFVVCDTTDKWSNGGIIGVWQMGGDRVNGLLKESPKISLSKFMKYGKRKLTKVDTIGWKSWYNTVLKRVPTRAACYI